MRAGAGVSGFAWTALVRLRARRAAPRPPFFLTPDGDRFRLLGGRLPVLGPLEVAVAACAPRAEGRAVARAAPLPFSFGPAAVGSARFASESMPVGDCFCAVAVLPVDTTVALAPAVRPFGGLVERPRRFFRRRLRPRALRAMQAGLMRDVPGWPAPWAARYRLPLGTAK